MASGEEKRRDKDKERSKDKDKERKRDRGRSDHSKRRRSRSRSNERRMRKKSRSRSRSRGRGRGSRSGRSSRSNSRDRSSSRDNKKSEEGRKRSGWDEAQAIENASVAIPNPNVQVARTIQAAQQAALALQGKIYVGSLDFELSETDIKTAFTPFGVIKSVSLARDTSSGRSKGYCFVDFVQPEAAQAALETMNGKFLAGRPIKVGRPSHMMPGILPPPIALQPSLPVLTPALPRPVQAPVPSPSTIYVGSIHWDITEDEIKAIFQGFGEIKNCALMPNPETGKHKGYGFVEFETQESAENALKYMNGFNIRRRPIKVGPAMMGAAGNVATPGTNVSVSDAIKNAAQIAASIARTSLGEESLSHEENLTISGKDRYLIMQKLSRGDATTSRCMILYDMVTIEELDDDLENEVAEECNKYGKVEKVVVYKEKLSDAPNDVVVKVFVVFEKAEQAEKATEVFNGRWFAGKPIKAERTTNPPFPLYSK